ALGVSCQEQASGALRSAVMALDEPLAAFSPRTRDWFTAAFAAPTAAQTQAWPAIASGEHVLISAPTGSGKTLAAFLWAIDALAAEHEGDERGAGGGSGPSGASEPCVSARPGGRSR